MFDHHPHFKSKYHLGFNSTFPFCQPQAISRGKAAFKCVISLSSTPPYKLNCYEIPNQYMPTQIADTTRSNGVHPRGHSNDQGGIDSNTYSAEISAPTQTVNTTRSNGVQPGNYSYDRGRVDSNTNPTKIADLTSTSPSISTNKNRISSSRPYDEPPTVPNLPILISGQACGLTILCVLIICCISIIACLRIRKKDSPCCGSFFESEQNNTKKKQACSARVTFLKEETVFDS